MSDPMTTEALAPCPFCGMKPSDDLSDTLYPSGIFWRHNPETGIRSYHGMSDRKEGDAQCFKIVCNETYGGCSAEVSGDSREEVAAKWNRRAQPARKRLTRAQVVDGFANCALDGVNARLGFNTGVRFTDNAHGITQKDAGWPTR